MKNVARRIVFEIFFEIRSLLTINGIPNSHRLSLKNEFVKMVQWLGLRTGWFLSKQIIY